MKQTSLSFFLYFIGLQAWAQLTLPANPSAEIEYDTIPAKGILLHKGWKFHPGDNPAWATPTLDDRNWLDFNPDRPPRKLPQLESIGIGWVRLHLRLGSRIQRQALFLIEDQFLASEVYLNGKLIRRYGTVSHHRDHVKSARLDYFNALELPLDGKVDQVLAIRFAVWSPLTRFNNYLVPYLFKYILVGKSQLLERFAEWILLPVMYAVLGGIFLLLCMLHIAFWRYNPARRANLYFAVYAFIQTVAFGSGIALWHETTIQVYLVLSLVMFVFFQMGNLFAVRALYSLFDVYLDWRYKLLWLVFCLCQLLFLTMPNGFWAFGSCMLLVTFEQVRLAFWALKARKRGARIIATGFACALLVMTSIITLNYGGVLTYSLYLFISLSFVLGAPAVGISLFLARELALDSQLLQVKLIQVRELSTKTIAQEKEKQQLLAVQNETLEQLVAQRTAQLQQSLDHLNATQTQLVQKEKMASLGELTAGIAHEIQNPLNFVNNFSELSTDLVDELSEGPLHHLPDSEQAYVAELLEDLTRNLKKINHHGQRASSIVKGMLEHSRNSTGDVQPTDLNALTEEFLRLAYHGQRAKDPGFNSELITQFDPAMGQVALMSQEMGRVLLNLFSNAFYAVHQRQKQGQPDYRPKVTVTTSTVKGGIQIRVADNGTGMAESVQQKIFQPFFTTKPTGEGTGLGLSLCYEIITKGHGGSLSVASQEGEGTEFTIHLPSPSQSQRG